MGLLGNPHHFRKHPNEEKNKTFEAQNCPLENGSTINLYHHVPATCGLYLGEKTAQYPHVSFENGFVCVVAK